MTSPRHPTAKHRKRVGQPLAMKFQWLTCPKHDWLGVSVLVVGDFPPICFLPDGSSHPADRSQLERAA